MKIFGFQLFNSLLEGYPVNMLIIAENKEKAYELLVEESKERDAWISNTWDVDIRNINEIKESEMSEGVFFQF